MNIVKESMKGILIGIASIIPGVSGGTMAISMGVYDKIIRAVTGLRRNIRQSILTLLPYGVGAAIGIGILSFVVKYALSAYPLQTSTLFIGMIMGGIPILAKKIRGTRLTATNISIFAVFFCVVSAMAFLNGSEGQAADIAVNPGTAVQLFFVGIIASATMIIPGVSGSLVMMILGFYGIIISNISNFISALLYFNIPALIHGTAVLLPFGTGVLIGIALVAKLIEVLFARAPVLTYFAIFGLIFGSPVAIIYKAGVSSVSIWSGLAAAIAFCLGFAGSFLLGREDNT